MATELIRPSCFKDENMEIPLIPPGFESFVNSDVKKIEDRETISTCSVSTSASASHPKQMKTHVESNDSKATRNLRRRSGISYSRLDDCSGDEFDSDQNLIQRTCLPKGVIRGCKDCSNCQKVTAKWRPENARMPNLENAPIFYPNEEEFEDTLAYIASIRPRAEKYGICRIVPPTSWKPPCPLLEKSTWEKSKFHTRVQKVDKLQNRSSVKKMLMAYNSKRKRKRCPKKLLNDTTGVRTELSSSAIGISEAECFGFEPGPGFTLQGFQKYANDFKGQYFRKDENMADPGTIMAANQHHLEPSVEDIEGEYWRLVEKPTEEVEVLYGADLETGVFGSGFPTQSSQKCAVSDDKYVKSGWNLNNFPRLPGSVLSYESSDISGVLVPWLYIGMCFSSFCWHVEDHYLYSLNYMHWGAPKMWYGVPGEEAVKLEAAMRKYLPDLFEEQPDLLHKLVTQLSPTILKREGVPVYRCVQNPGEFVLTFPRAYHSGFNCGFNCAEAVNVAPVDWLPFGYNAIEFYRMQGRKTSISHDKLLLGAAREAVKAHWELNLLKKNTFDNARWKSLCGSDGILSKALKARIEMELERRRSLCISSNAVKMSSDFDATSERECCVCLFDLHLSAVGCRCSPDRYTCMYHANHLCACSWNTKFYLFRYDVNELNILVEAVEGKLSAVYRWARLDLGLALSSQPSRSIQGSKTTGDLSVTETSLQPPAASLKVIIKKEYVDKVPEEQAPEVVLALEAVKLPSDLPKPLLKVKLGKYNSCTVKKGLADIDSAPHISQQVGSSIDKKLEGKKSLISQNNNIIVLSDDEGEVSNAPTSGREKQASAVVAEQFEEPKDFGNTMSSCKPIKGPNMDLNYSTSRRDSDRGLGPLNCQMCTESNPISPSSYRESTFTVSDKGFGNLSNAIANGDCNIIYIHNGSDSQHGLSCGNAVLDGENRHKISLNTNLLSTDDTVPNMQTNVDRFFRQKGPRIAKVVRRINCNVEPLEYGVVHSGMFWCDSRAIFPLGFKTRVKYINVLDPTSMCYYVSEILDGGLDRPLFMVSLEHCPSEIFAHVSADKCWDLVRERVNQEITKQHKLGKTKLHPLQPPKSLDGLEMFGFTSPAIVQVIQAMDKNQVCSDYWKSRPLMQMSQCPSSECDNAKPSMTNDLCNEQKPTKADLVFGSLLNKANPEELQALYSILGEHKSATDQGLVTKLLNQEIHERQKHF